MQEIEPQGLWASGMGVPLHDHLIATTPTLLCLRQWKGERDMYAALLQHCGDSPPAAWE